MKNENTAVIVVIAVLVLLLTSGFGMMGFGGYCGHMMNIMYGNTFSFISAWIIQILIVILLVLGILWLVKQLQK